MKDTNFVHNVKLNWAINEHSPCNIHEYFAWTDADLIEVVRDLYIVKVTEEFFDFATFGLFELPVSFWKHVKGKSVNSKSFTDINYTCAITDGKRVMAIDTWVGYFHAMKKSRMSLWDESDVLEKAKGLDVMSFAMVRTEYICDTEFTLLRNENMVGLTRSEIEDTMLLLEYVDYFVEIQDVSALKYYLKEFDNDRFRVIDTSDVGELYVTLVGCILSSWSDGHNRLLDVLNVSMDILDAE